MGDLNVTPDSKAIAHLRNNMKDPVEEHNVHFYGSLGTFNHFKLNAVLDHRIDYIFYKKLTASQYIHIDDRRANSHWISHHLPIFIQLVGE